MNAVLANNLQALEKKQQKGELTGEMLQEHQLLVGVVRSLIGWQATVMEQEKLEQLFSWLHIGTGGATSGGMTALAVAGGLVPGGIIAAPVLGPVVAVATVGGVVWAGASVGRSRKQHQIEHKQKWRQRAALVVGLEMSRTELEKRLAGNGAGLKVQFREGDYLLEEERFAGSREMQFDARDNDTWDFARWRTRSRT